MIVLKPFNISFIICATEHLEKWVKQVKTMGLCMKLKKSSRKGKLCKAMIFKNFVSVNFV